jgi:outer membrane protein insertion porin family/translocation and assembly module TamA
MARLRGIALVRLALLALASMSAVPAVAAAQDVLCETDQPEVRAVHFVGNTTFSNDELSARVLTTPSSSTRRLLRVFGARRCYPDIGLLNDVTNLKSFYHNNGFYDTRVDTVVKKLSGNRVDITFLIAEGRPLILDSLAITGLDSLPGREEVLRDSVLRIGERAGPVQILAQRDTLITRLRNAGYPNATAFLSSDTHPTEHSVEVSIDVQPGARARFGNITVTSSSVKGGPPEVKDSVVMRLLGLRRGELYSDRALTQASRNLYNVSMFRHVDVALDTMFTHGDTVADVLVDLREDYMRQIDLEEGWGQLDCLKINGLYTDKNFRDQAQSLQFTARLSKLGYAEKASTGWTKDLCDRHYLDNDSLASSKVNDYFGVSVRYPTLSLFSFTPAYSIYTERQGQYQAYLRTTDVGFGVSGTKDITARTNMRLGYNFEHGATQAEPVILCALFNRCTIEEQAEVQDRLALGVASAALQRVTTDNLVVPTRGYRTGLEVRYSAPFIGSNPTLDFFKVTANVAWYHQLRRGVVFAASSTGGFILGGQTIEGTRLPPPQERLYAGGPTSMRGYQQNQLGPQVYLLNRDQLDSTLVAKDTFYYTSKIGARQDRSIPGGGNLLALLNAELRIRDPFFPDLLEYAPFIDAGQVWATQISTNVTRQPIAWAPGLAIRYFSPVGPILVNVGYNRYPPTPGPAYFLSSAGEGTRPLICVTNPGDPPILVVRTSEGLVQNNASCPSNFSPPSAKNFFQRLTFTITIGTAF